MVKDSLARPDWYGDLSHVAQNIWGNAVYNFCSSKSRDAVGFRVDHDGVYWDVLELALKQLKVPTDKISPDVALSTFGKRPYRYHLSTGAAKGRGKEDGDDEEFDDYDFDMDWHEMQSLHTPDEVRKMLEELRSVGPAIAKLSGISKRSATTTRWSRCSRSSSRKDECCSFRSIHNSESASRCNDPM